jgi:hypothetical protein
MVTHYTALYQAFLARFNAVDGRAAGLEGGGVCGERERAVVVVVTAVITRAGSDACEVLVGEKGGVL